MKIIFLRVAIRNLAKAGGLSEALFQEAVHKKRRVRISPQVITGGHG